MYSPFPLQKPTEPLSEPLCFFMCQVSDKPAEPDAALMAAWKIRAQVFWFTGGIVGNKRIDSVGDI